MADEIYLLWHEYECADGRDELKLIGAYKTHEAAAKALERTRPLPGFCDHPDGFEIAPVRLDEDGWTDGFVVMVIDEHSNADPEAASRGLRSGIVPITHHVRPAPDGYWMYEIRRGETSLGCEVGRIGDSTPLAQGLAEAVAFQRAVDDAFERTHEGTARHFHDETSE